MDNKVVLITGCSTGIGKELSKIFHKKKFTVYATARKPETLKELEEMGLKTDRLDVNSESDIKRVVKRVIEEEGRIDILINNAGYIAVGPIAEISIERFRDQMETNVVSLVAIIQAAVPYMIERKEGTIVNIGSVSGLLTTPFSGAYCASKAAVHSVSDALRMELAPFNIRVLTVQPGAVKSNLGNNAEKTAEEVIEKNGSVYSSLADAIRKRANSSQENPTPVEEFTEKVYNEVVYGKKEVFRLGKMSGQMGFMAKWLPVKVTDKIFKRKFSLD